MKLNQLILVTIAGLQFILPVSAADDAATNSAGAASPQIPAYTAGGSTADSSAESAEIEALKKAINDLGQKVQALEQQRALDQQTATNIAIQQTQELDQKVRILARERELDQEAAVAAAKAAPKLSIGPGGFSASSAD